MSTFVKSLRRLYQSGRLTDEALSELLKGERITQEAFEYITNV